MSNELTASIPTALPLPAQDAATVDEPGAWLERRLERIPPVVIGVAFVLLALAVYVLSDPARQNFYNHFVWQADAFLHGRVAIPWVSGEGANGYFQDIVPAAGLPGYGLLPFPPLPAVLLMPLVAVWGLDTNAALFAAVLGALNVGLCWRMLTRVTERRDAAALGTFFYGFGTVAWYAAMLGSTWFLAHVVASTFVFLGITAALDAERREAARATAQAVGASLGRLVHGRQVLAGLLFGMACLSRLTTLFGAPFFVFVGGGGSALRRAISAGLGAAIPLALLLGFNVATSGHLFNPAYDTIRQNEYKPKPDFYQPTWGTEDPRYILQNAQILLFWPPVRLQADDSSCEDPLGATPGIVEQLTDASCPIRPDKLGMSILLTSPAYLLLIPVMLTAWRRRIVAGAALAVLAIALADLAHFSQGWVQFGYRFSNDFAPFAMILVALGIVRARRRRATSLLATALIGISVLVNAWGVYWGVTLGW